MEQRGLLSKNPEATARKFKISGFIETLFLVAKAQVSKVVCSLETENEFKTTALWDYPIRK
jgi:hypothetical protein